MAVRILQVVTDTDRRGAQVFATDLHGAFDHAGYEVRTVALAPGTTGGIELHVLGDRRLGWATLAALWRELRTVDVAIAHGSSTLPACALASFGTKTPFVYRQISDSLFWASTRLRRLRVRAGLVRAARIVALWSGSADTLHASFGVPRDRIRVIPNGVAPERLPQVDRQQQTARRRSFGLDPSKPTALYLGALASEKGVDLVIDAIAQLDDLQLLVGGDGPERQRLEAQAALVAPGRVVFTGSLPDPVAAYGATDVVVLASRGGDSMPAVLIEAGISGLPSVATPVEGIPEIVIPGVTGSLVPVGDTASLASAIRSIAHDPTLARRFGEAARAHCLERFSIEPVAAAWTDTLDEVATVGR